MTAGGLVLTVLPFILGIKFFVMWIYGVPLFILGVFILFNKKEDGIEKIKSGGKKKWQV